MSDVTFVHDAARATLAAGTGRIQQFVRTEDGSAVALTEALFDTRRRRASMSHRFLVLNEEPEEPVEHEDAMEWQLSVAGNDLLHLQRPGVAKEWSTVRAPWPSGSPALVLYWLLGASVVHDSRQAVSLIACQALKVELSVARAIESAGSMDLEGVRASFEEAGLVPADVVQADVVVSAAGVIRSLSLVLPGDDGGLTLELEFDELGKPFDIELPQHGPVMVAQDLVRDLVSGESEEV